MRRWLTATVLAALVAGPALGFDEPEDLPEGEGREETFYLCIACHSFTLVANQRMSRELWDDTFQFMIDRHGMFEPGNEERALIVDYLAHAFPPQRAQRGWTNPFAPPAPAEAETGTSR